MKIISISSVTPTETVPPLRLPLATSSIPAGFPSPADDFIDTKLDLNEYLIKHPAATFFVKVSGDSMVKAGIFSGDILIVDRSLDPSHGSVIVAVLDGELTVKRFKKYNNIVILYPENDSYKPIEVTPDREFQVWGVVTYVIHRPL